MWPWHEGQIEEVRPICPTTTKVSGFTERCLKGKLQIYPAPRNGSDFLLGVVHFNLELLFERIAIQPTWDEALKETVGERLIIN
jgi:hypothetical protein